MAELFDSERFEHVNRAAKDDPFAGLINKYYRKNRANQEVIDRVFSDLHESPVVTGLKQQLKDERPAYTTVFRYDPESIQMVGSDDGCFGSRDSMGAYNAYARVFERLQPEAVQVLRLADDAQVVINQPGILINPDGSLEGVAEPTVLFSLSAINDIKLRSKDEAKQLGRLISHGQEPQGALLDYRPNLVSYGILQGIINIGSVAVAAAK